MNIFKRELIIWKINRDENITGYRICLNVAKEFVERFCLVRFN